MCVCVGCLKNTASGLDAHREARKDILTFYGQNRSTSLSKPTKRGKICPGRRCFGDIRWIKKRPKEGGRVSRVTRVSQVPLTRTQRCRPPRSRVPSSVASSRGDGPLRARILIAVRCQHGENSTIGTTAPM